jgi:hypothetical protein
MMGDKWLWGVLPHNCASFVKDVIKAGGGDLRVMLNCPDQEVVKGAIEVIKEAIDRQAEFQRANRGPKW